MEEKKSNKKKNKKKTLIIIAAVIVVIIVLIYLLFFVLNQYIALSPDEQKFIGTWKGSNDSSARYTFRLEGFSKKVDVGRNGTISYTDDWRVENGVLYMDGSVVSSWAYQFKGDDILVLTQKTSDLPPGWSIQIHLQRVK